MSAKEFLERFPDHPASRELTAGQSGSISPSKKRAATPKSKGTPSYLESLFEQQLRAIKAPRSTKEYAFHPDRRWRMDFAWPEYRVAVEIEGGVWQMGRHNRPRGFIADAEKYNAAAQLGWIVLRFTAKSIRSGQAIDQTLSVLEERRHLRDNYITSEDDPSLMVRRPQAKP